MATKVNMSRPQVIIYDVVTLIGYIMGDMFFLFIQNNKLQTQIQLQTWTDKKHRTGQHPLGCQKRVPYPVGIINDNTNSDRW